MITDLKFAFRLLVKSPGTTIAAIVALGFGIGLATSIFNAFSAMLIRPFPHIVEEDRLVFLNSVRLNQPDSFFELSLPDFVDLRAQSQTLEGLTTTQSRTMILGHGETPERALGASISVEGFAMLGVKPWRGRLFAIADGADDAAPVAIISHALWQRRFGGRDDVISRNEIINGSATTIIGVMPPGFAFPDRHEMWVPFLTKNDPKERASHFLPGWARLKSGVTLDEAKAEIAAIGAQLSAEYPTSNAGKGLALRLVREEATQDSALLMRLMLGAAICVLLIACANVANLLLARAAGRSHEIAIRIAVGATRSRIMRQMLTESLLLGVLGGAFGLLVGAWANSLIMGAIPEVEIPYWMTFDVDWRVYTFTALAALASAGLAGIFPALHASQMLATDLREGNRSISGGGRSRFARQGLVVLQVALSTVLLIAAGLFVRSFLRLQETPPGYNPAGVLTFRVGLPPTQFTDQEVNHRFFDELTPRLAETPGVLAVGSTMMLPSHGNNSNVFILEGQSSLKNLQDAPEVTSHIVSRDYFAAMQIPLLRGRHFQPTDQRASPRVVLVDQQFVDRWLNGADPIGKRLTFSVFESSNIEWATIVGVVGNVPQQLDRANLRGSVYNALEQSTVSFMSYAVRVVGDPATYGPALQRAVVSVMPGIPIYNVHTMTYVHDIAYWEKRFFGQVFSAFGLGALFLAALGIYGLMAYNVSQRSAEIGVRMALGATERDVLKLVGRQGLSLVALGLALGLIGAFGVTRFMAALLYGISPSDPPTYVALSSVLALVGVLACWLPARRATRVDPMIALRSD